MPLYTAILPAGETLAGCIFLTLSQDVPLILPQRAAWFRAKETTIMTRRCDLMGTLPLSGQLRSHAENKTKRKFRPNLCNVTLMSDILGRKFRLRVSARALKSVEHRGGLDAYLLKARNEQLSPDCLKIKREIQKATAAAKVAA